MTVELADQDVRHRISVTGLGDTLFVEAGAGTGKTTQLVERVVNLVLDRDIALRDIAAITFTEAAAAELRDRIRVAFEREALASAGDRRDRSVAAVADSDQAAITTLHGFARRILAEHPLAAGLPPRVEIADEIESQLAFEHRWERFVDGLYADPRLETLLERAALTGVELEQRYPNHATLKDVAAILSQSWDRLSPIAVRTVEPLGPVDFAPFDDAVAELAEVRESCVDPTDKLCGHLDVLLPELQQLVEIVDPNHKLSALRDAGEWKKSGFGTAAAWGRDAKEVRAYVDAVNTAKQRVTTSAAHGVLERLRILISREILAAAESRRSDGRLEFHDLLVLARTVLHDSDPARRSLHDRYRCLLLDEFQDTDPIQIELAVQIAGAIDGDERRAWSDVLVEAGRLFFVGDPKQSIYRFRRADIELFLAARDRYGADDCLVRLSTNFRTVEPIVNWVNQLFLQLMPEENPGRQPKYEPLTAHRQPSAAGDHRPVRLGGPHSAGRAADLREAEAADVAAVIADVRDRPDAWPVFDAELGTWRPGRLTDVTILVPTRTSVPYLRAALDAAAIPYRLDTGTLVFDTQEIRDLLSAVRAVDDPTDEASVVAALRSPLYGCSDVELFTYTRGGGRWNPATEPPPGLVEAGHPVAMAMTHLHGLWRERWWLRPADVVERIIRERRAMLAAFGDERPREVWRRLRFLLDQARSFDDAGGGGLRAFTDWAELQQSGASRVHEPLLAETDDEAVRVMTVHGAKGLEFPITILSGMTTRPSSRRSGANVIWNGDEPEIKVGSKVLTDNFDPRVEVEDEMDVDEKLRLLYVAATRARDHLVVSCHHKRGPNGGDGSYGNRIWDAMTDDLHAEQWRPVELEPAKPPKEARAAGPAAEGLSDRGTWLAARTELFERNAITRVTSATAIAAASRVQAATASGVPVQLSLGLDADDGVQQLELAADAEATSGELAEEARGTEERATGDDERVWRRGRAGTAIGRAVHATLQSVALSVALDDPVIDRIAAREASLEAVPEAADTVAAMVRSGLAADAVALARQHPHHKELYVAAPVGGASSRDTSTFWSRLRPDS